MLSLLGEKYRFGEDVTRRRMTLFACVCCRRIWSALPDARSRELVELSERELDESVSVFDLWEAEDAAKKAAEEITGFATWTTWILAEMSQAANPADTAAIAECAAKAYAFAELGVHEPRSSAWIAAERNERRRQAMFLRDIFGNPFRPITIDRTWLTPTVMSLATAAYTARELPSGHLDPNRLAVLADALEEVGCVNAEILSHFRNSSPHVRGCRPLDLILAKDR